MALFDGRSGGSYHVHRSRSIGAGHMANSCLRPDASRRHQVLIQLVHSIAGACVLSSQPRGFTAQTSLPCCAVQADIFSFGVLMYELLCGCITSQLVVGPTGNMRAAEVYAAKACCRPLFLSPHNTVSVFTDGNCMVCVHAEGLSSLHSGLVCCCVRMGGKVTSASRQEKVCRLAPTGLQ